MGRIIFVGLCLFLLLCHSVFANDIGSNLEKAYLKTAEGDVRAVLSILNSVKEVDQSEFIALRQKYEKRFITANEQIEFDDPFIADLYKLYATYWRASLLDPNLEKKARKVLLVGLNNLAISEGRKDNVLDFIIGPHFFTLEKFFIKTARDKDYYLLMGKTGPLCELMIWKKEERKSFHVELPPDSLYVNVIFAQDFLSKGWFGYATFDKMHNRGWTKGNTIYYVDDIKPDESNEWFHVSLLGHEGRHILDRKLYGKLVQWRCEYRAKLTELLLAEDTFWQLINVFRDEADDVYLPHPYGSHRLLNDLMKELSHGKETESFRTFRFEGYSKERIKGAVKVILEKNSKSLKR